MDPKTVLYIGPQGSGKGTQIARLTAHLKDIDPVRRVIDIQTGRRFRALAEKQENFTERHILETLDTGVLQPLFISVMLWGDAMRERLDPDVHLLIDGFPRTVEEAVVLESAFLFYQRSPIDVVYLDAPEEIVRERMLARKRGDDTTEAIEERLRWFRTETRHVVEYYKSRRETNLIVVDGTGTVDDVFKDTCAGLKI